MIRNICYLVVVCFSLIMSSAGLYAGEMEPAAALKIIRQAHLANEDKYPSGKLHFRILKSQITPGNAENTFYESMDGISIWLGDKIRTELKRWGPSNKEVDMTSPTGDEVICILDARSFTTYNPNTSNVFVTPLAGQKPFPEYCVTPKHYWFGYQIHQDYPAYKAFDPVQMPADRIPVAKIAVSNEKDGVIRFSRIDQDTKSTLFARYSLPDSGNLLDFQNNSVSTDLKISAKLNWSRNRDQELYLYRIDRKVESKSKFGWVSQNEICEVLDFQPGYKVPSNMFSLSSLDLPDGTMVDNKVTGKRYRIGDKPANLILNSIPDLIRSMKSRGFASPAKQ